MSTTFSTSDNASETVSLGGDISAGELTATKRCLSSMLSTDDTSRTQAHAQDPKDPKDLKAVDDEREGSSSDYYANLDVVPSSYEDIFGDDARLSIELKHDVLSRGRHRDRRQVSARDFQRLVLYLCAVDTVAPRWAFVRHRALVSHVVVLQLAHLSDENIGRLKRALARLDEADEEGEEGGGREILSEDRKVMVRVATPLFDENNRYPIFRKLSIVQVKSMKGLDQHSLRLKLAGIYLPPSSRFGMAVTTSTGQQQQRPKRRKIDKVIKSDALKNAPAVAMECLKRMGMVVDSSSLSSSSASESRGEREKEEGEEEEAKKEEKLKVKGCTLRSLCLTVAELVDNAYPFDLTSTDDEVGDDDEIDLDLGEESDDKGEGAKDDKMKQIMMKDAARNSKLTETDLYENGKYFVFPVAVAPAADAAADPSHQTAKLDPCEIPETAETTQTSEKDTKTKHKKALLDAVALDCEMVLTDFGMELASVCVVAFESGEPIYHTLVKPFGTVRDYLTKWSGITAAMLADHSRCKSGVRQVFEDLCALGVHSETVLIGHGLENDLSALRISHHCVVDTSVIYRPRGSLESSSSSLLGSADASADGSSSEKKTYQYKHKLKYLALRFLRRKIQEDKGKRTGHVLPPTDTSSSLPSTSSSSEASFATVETESKIGHDPQEDALAALDLVKLKMQKGAEFGNGVGRARGGRVFSDRAGDGDAGEKTEEERRRRELVMSKDARQAMTLPAVRDRMSLFTMTRLYDFLPRALSARDNLFFRPLRRSHLDMTLSPSETTMLRTIADRVKATSDGGAGQGGQQAKKKKHTLQWAYGNADLCDMTAMARSLRDLVARMADNSVLVVVSGKRDTSRLKVLQKKKVLNMIKLQRRHSSSSSSYVDVEGVGEDGGETVSAIESKIAELSAEIKQEEGVCQVLPCWFYVK